MIFRTTFALLATASAAMAAPAAAPTADRDMLRQYCTGDYLTYCGDRAPDSPETRACFKQNKARLSPGCQAAISTYMKGQKRAEAR